MTNVYAAPTAELIDTAETGDTRMFTLNGRIGRVRLLGYSFGAYLLVSLALGVLVAVFAAGTNSANPVWITALSLIANLAVFFILTRRRLQDFGASPWLMVLGLIPVVNLIFFLWTLFKRGDAGPNEYGPPPRPNDRAAILLAWIMPAVMIIGILAAIALPAYQSYTMKARAAQQLQMAPR